MQPVQSVTIIGAGVVGCFLAYRLASEGVPVTVIERQHVGAGASGASAGNVQPGEVDIVLAAESLELFRRFLPAIKEESGIDPQDHEVHYLYAALDEQEVAQTQEFSTVLQQGGLRVEWIDGPTVRALESRFVPGVLGGAWHRDCMQMDAYRFVMALSKAMQGRGVQVRQGEVVGLQHSGERVTGVRLRDGTTLACDTLVLALGAWTGVAASQWLGVSLPIEPHSLQKLHVRPMAEPLRCAVRWSEVNVVSRVDGLVHVGSKHDPTGFTAQPTPEGRHWLLERLNTVLPAFEFEVVAAGAGLAASTPKKVPVLGPLPGFASAYVAVPSTNGFLLSAVLTHILTELFVHGRQHALLPDLLPERALCRASTAG
jgi:glycine oxidase